MTRPELIESMEMREKAISILHWIRVLIVAMFIVCSRFTVTHLVLFHFGGFVFFFAFSSYNMIISSAVLFFHFNEYVSAHNLTIAYFRIYFRMRDAHMGIMCTRALYKRVNLRRKEVLWWKLQSSFVPHFDVSGRLKRRKRNRQKNTNNNTPAMHYICLFPFDLAQKQDLTEREKKRERKRDWRWMLATTHTRFYEPCSFSMLLFHLCEFAMIILDLFVKHCRLGRRVHLL